MPGAARRKIANQVLIELVEADIDIGFALVDEAKGYVSSGQFEVSSRVLQVAEGVISDIEHRLKGLGVSESEPFDPLVSELRNQIAAVERDPS